MEKSLPLVFISSKTKKAKIIENLLRKNSTLAALLGQGVRIRNPHKPAGAGVGIAGFIGNRFPTKFHFKGHDPSVDVTRDAHLNSHVRITFETDAANDYFNREDEPGKFTLYRIVGGKSVAATNYQRPRLHNGLAHLSLVLPDDAKVGDELTFLSLVTDPSRIEPLRNMFVLNVIAERQTKSGGSGGNGGSGSDTGTDKGSKGGGKGQTQDSQLDIPEPFHVYEKDWDKHEFNKFTVMHVKKPPDAKPDEERYDYYINMDNVYVQSFMKEEPKRAKTLRLKFSIAMTLVALSLLLQDQLQRKSGRPHRESGNRVDVRDQVADVTCALAPFVLPMIESVGQLEDDAEYLSESAGEAA